VAVLITNRPNQVVVSSPGPQGPAGGGAGGGVTEVTGTAPISVATGTTTPVVSLDADGITTGKIADEAVTNGKIADLTIQTGKIADGAITAAKLADTSVTSITAGAGLTGGTITTTGTIAHAAGSFVGSEEYPVRIVVDAFGHVQVNESETTAAAYRTATGTDDADNLISGTVALARLPALAAAYTGQIETIDDKTYTIDPGVVAGRTITSFYARSGAGTCTATLKNAALTVGVVSVTTSSTTAVISNTTVAADSALTIVITSNVAATDVVFSVEFTQ
jgi:trimeric autotransporter adhesin